jgi:M6 family metalloprotease-like protein
LSCKHISTILLAAPLLLSAIAPGLRAATNVVLSDARFNGLTRIVVNTNVPLSGLAAAQVVVTRPDGRVVPPGKITAVVVSGKSVSITIHADQFARITSEGTTVATRRFGSFGASKAVKVERRGEPAANGHIIGTSNGLDEGWNSTRTDLNYVDPVTGEKGYYHIDDVTPDRDENGKPVAWNDGKVTVPVYKPKRMLALFVEFPDRLAKDAEPPYDTPRAHLEFIKGAEEWYRLSSYGQLKLSLVAPQVERDLGWIMMDRKAAESRTGSNPMWAYVGDVCQKAYDKFGIMADEYDLLVILPARGRTGLSNGPTYLHNKGGAPGEPRMNRVAFYDKDKKPHYIDTAITAGNDLWRWGYRWVTHESGHSFGLPDLYSYEPTINQVRVGSFFFCGGWDMMGWIAGQSTDYLAWHKWKLRWIRDDQVDVVTRPTPQPTTHYLSPVETPGGTKMVVVRTGLSTAYIAEFRTKLGIEALDGRGKYTGVLIYRIDASKAAARGPDFTGQIISKKYYNSPAVGGPKNLTGLWRPVDNSTDGYDEGGVWLPGDVFSDPATGVTISVEDITHFDSANPSGSPYTENDIATVTVATSKESELFKPVVLSNARLKDLTELTFDTNIELQYRLPGRNPQDSQGRIREDSLLYPSSLVIEKANGTVVPAAKITKVVVNPTSVQVTLAKDVFPNAKAAAGATVGTRPYFFYGAGAPVPIQ